MFLWRIAKSFNKILRFAVRVQSILYPASLLSSTEICFGSRGVVHFCPREEQSHLPDPQHSTGHLSLAPHVCWEYHKCLNMLAVIPSLLHSCFLSQNPAMLWCWPTWGCRTADHNLQMGTGSPNATHTNECHTVQPGLCSVAFLWASRHLKCFPLYGDSIITLHFSICSFQIFYYQGVSWMN